MSDNKSILFIPLQLLCVCFLFAQPSGIKVEQLYNDLRFEEAIENGKELLQNKQVLNKSDLLVIHRYMAYSYFNLSQPDSARAHFLTLLSLDDKIQLDPIRTSPKIIDFFKEVRKEYNQIKKSKRLVPVKEYLFIEDPRPSAAWRSAVLPGWGQYYKNQHRRAYWFGGAFVVSLTLTAAAWMEEKKYKDLYLKEQNPADIPALYDKYNGWSKTKRVFGYTAAAIWLASFADALWSDYPRISPQMSSDGSVVLSIGFEF